MYSFAVYPYLNAVPLYSQIGALCPRAKIVYSHPSGMLSLLKSGTADAVLLPVADLIQVIDRVDLMNVGIAACGEVKSVLLLCERHITNVKTIRLDDHSRTSNLLAKLLVPLHFQQAAHFVRSPGKADAEIVIGDRALTRDTQTLHRYDLSLEWNKLTSMPFVFAVWAIAKHHPNLLEIQNILSQAKTYGCRNIPEIAFQESKRLNLSHDVCLDYLQNNIQYDLAPTHRLGLYAFIRLASALHLWEDNSNRDIHLKMAI